MEKFIVSLLIQVISNAVMRAWPEIIKAAADKRFTEEEVAEILAAALNKKKG